MNQITEMQRAINALRLELPASIVDDIQEKFDAALSHNSGWVSVDERLPDGDVVCYLTYSAEAEQGCKMTVSAFVREHRCFYPDDEALINVTHWMPLPAPPSVNQSQGEKQEDV